MSVFVFLFAVHLGVSTIVLRLKEDEWGSKYYDLMRMDNLLPHESLVHHNVGVRGNEDSTLSIIRNYKAQYNLYRDGKSVSILEKGVQLPPRISPFDGYVLNGAEVDMYVYHFVGNFNGEFTVRAVSDFLEIIQIPENELLSAFSKPRKPIPLNLIAPLNDALYFFSAARNGERMTRNGMTVVLYAQGESMPQFKYTETQDPIELETMECSLRFINGKVLINSNPEDDASAAIQAEQPNESVLEVQGGRGYLEKTNEFGTTRAYVLIRADIVKFSEFYLDILRRESS